MAELMEMAECEARRLFVIEDDGGDVGQRGATGNDYCGQCRGRVELSVDCEDAVYATCSQKIGIGTNEFSLVPVMDGEVEIAFSYEVVASAAEYLRVVAFAEFWKEHPDCTHSFSLKRACDHARLVVEFGCRGLYASSGGLRNRTAGRFVKNKGNR